MLTSMTEQAEEGEARPCARTPRRGGRSTPTRSNRTSDGGPNGGTNGGDSDDESGYLALRERLANLGGTMMDF